MECTTIGLPEKSTRFFRGMPFDPPRAGMIAKTSGVSFPVPIVEQSYFDTYSVKSRRES